MKKNMFAVLLLVLALLCSAAFAESEKLPSETVSEKVNLWSHNVVVMDQAGETATYPITCTFEPKAPVELTVLPVADLLKDQIYICSVTREGVGDVMIALSPADRGLHFNLNDYTDEMLADYIQSVAEANFAEGEYTAEVMVSEGGNTFVRVGTDYQETLSTIYDDFTMEFYLQHIEGDALQVLTEEDKAFAIEMFQSVWTEETQIPPTDIAITLNVNEKFLADLGIENYESIVNTLNQVTLLFHDEDNYVHFALKSGDEELLNADLTADEEGALIQSNILNGKGIYMSKEFAVQAAKSAQDGKVDELPTALQTVSFTKTISAAAEAVAITTAEDGSMVFTVTSENMNKVLNAVAEDIKDSGVIAKVLPMYGINDLDEESINMLLDIAVQSAAEMLPEGDFITISIGQNESGDQMLVGSIQYNKVDYSYNEATQEVETKTTLNAIGFVGTLHVSEEGTFEVNAVFTNGAEDAETVGYATLNAVIPLNGEYHAELAVGSAKGETEIKTDYSITLKNARASEDFANMEMTQLALNLPDNDGNLQEFISLVNLFTGKGEDNIQAFMVNVAAYDEPVLVLRTAQVFAEEREVPVPTEVIKAEEVDENFLNEIRKNVDEKLQSITSNVTANAQ
ncbi:MAG: hypothetical protein IJ242_06755 [Clostridia bacterium]|nr:hypothetical protein [Clostridia bacterium]